MNKNILITGLLLMLVICSCYKDKGNYDYKNVNDFEVVITPAPADEERNIYLVNQPGVTADTFRLSAEGKQTMNSTEDNLEYVWYRTLQIDKGTPTTDTIFGKENVMELVPSKKSVWNILLVVRDKNTDLEYYKSLTVQTKVPFYNSWLFLHGNHGERKIGALSWDATGKPEVTLNIMEAMGQPGYPFASNITYTNYGAEDYLQTERLFVTSSPDSVTYVFPFDCKVKGKYQEMGMARNLKIREIIATPFGKNAGTGLITTDGKLFFGNNWGVPTFETTRGNVADNYKIDLAYVDAQGYITMWDNTNKRLMYFLEGSLGYVGTLGSKDLQGKKALWLGRDAKTVGTDQEPCLFIAKNESNNKCYLYRISYSSKDGKMAQNSKGKDEGKDEYAYGTVTCDSSNAWGFTEKTLFAVSDYYQDQFFFTEENAVYRGIMANGEKIQLYTPAGTIKKIAFRLTNDCSVAEYKGNMRILSLLVTNANGMDEIHEIHLNNAGDVEQEHVYDLGNVSVIDWGFSAVDRLPDR